jgi:pimeloyl-ACP methyl ester carboxylesterase
MIVEANGLRFSVTDVGEGPAVMLLHGFPDTSRLWRRQIEALTRAGYRTIAPDLRGRGGTERPQEVGSYAVPMLLRDVTGIMDALGVPRAHLVGHDWGAGLAWLLAASEPRRAGRLVALSVGFPGASGRPGLEDLQKGWYRLLFQFAGVAEDLLRQDDWYLARVLLDSNPDLEECLRDLSEPGALTAALNWYRANMRVERLLQTFPGLPAVEAATLGVWSTGDVYLTERAMTASAAHVAGGWRYQRMEDAGHWIPLDQPERLNSLLLDFLRQ